MKERVTEMQVERPQSSVRQVLKVGEIQAHTTTKVQGLVYNNVDDENSSLIEINFCM